MTTAVKVGGCLMRQILFAMAFAVTLGSISNAPAQTTRGGGGETMSEKLGQDGAWIFVSHSNKDMKKVREIRDLLEREGHKPLLFYLKCLDQRDARLPQLIKDEIEARTWFVLCESDNARSSHWVQEEMKIVKSMAEKSRFYVTIDLARDLESQRGKLTLLSKRATVFISYARPDREIAEQIYLQLARQDYRVFFDEQSLDAGAHFVQAITTSIEEAVERGFVLLLLSPAYLASAWCARERAYAFELLRLKPLNNIVPIVVKDDALVKSQLPVELRDIQCVNLTDGPIGPPALDPHQKIDMLLSFLKTRPVA